MNVMKLFKGVCFFVFLIHITNALPCLVLIFVDIVYHLFLNDLDIALKMAWKFYERSSFSLIVIDMETYHFYI